MSQQVGGPKGVFTSLSIWATLSAALAAAFTLSVAFLLLVGLQPATAQEPPEDSQTVRSATLSVSPSSKTVDVGDSYEITLTAGSLPQVGNCWQAARMAHSEIR